MRKDGIQLIARDKLIDTIKKSRKDIKKLVEIHNRTPEELIVFLCESSGIMNAAGIIRDDRGIDTDGFQFTHQSFQEYLAGQAILHGWGKIGNFGSHRDTLRTIINELRAKEVSVETMKWRDAKEFVLAENWQETIRMYVCLR
jgi:hypothetical protein